MATELEVGTVKEVLADKGKVIVHFAQHDEQDSYELSVLYANTLNNKHYRLPDVDEQVVVLTDENMEEGVILGSIYSDVDQPPLNDPNKYHFCWDDGTTVEYDRKAHKLKLKVSSSGTIEIECEGNVSVQTDKSLKLEAEQKIALTAPEIVLNTASLTCTDPESELGTCNATIRGNVDIRGNSFQLNTGNFSSTAIQTRFNGPLSVQGDITATGAILDAGGNSNHHVH
jgi:phage baseplate assembly protein V